MVQINLHLYNTSKKCCDCHGDLEYVNSKTIRTVTGFENKKIATKSSKSLSKN